MDDVLLRIISGVSVAAICGLFKAVYGYVRTKMRQKKERRANSKDRRS